MNGIPIRFVLCRNERELYEHTVQELTRQGTHRSISCLTVNGLNYDIPMLQYVGNKYGRNFLESCNTMISGCETDDIRRVGPMAGKLHLVRGGDMIKNMGLSHYCMGFTINNDLLLNYDKSLNEMVSDQLPNIKGKIDLPYKDIRACYDKKKEILVENNVREVDLMFQISERGKKKDLIVNVNYLSQN